jgi:hypothetical protein
MLISFLIIIADDIFFEVLCWGLVLTFIVWTLNQKDDSPPVIPKESLVQEEPNPTQQKNHDEMAK